MTQSQRPLKVFLCHAHADRDAVRALYTRLTNDGVDAWFDKEKLLPGQDWELEIKKAVREADVVVVCLSQQFNQAGFRQKEVRLALDTAMEKPEGEIFIIPARLEECDNLESLRKWHWVDLFEDDGYEKLLSGIRVQDKDNVTKGPIAILWLKEGNQPEGRSYIIHDGTTANIKDGFLIFDGDVNLVQYAKFTLKGNVLSILVLTKSIDIYVNRKKVHESIQLEENDLLEIDKNIFVVKLFERQKN